MKSLFWYITDVLKEYPKDTVVTTDLLIKIIDEAGEQQEKDETDREEGLEFHWNGE